MGPGGLDLVDDDDDDDDDDEGACPASAGSPRVEFIADNHDHIPLEDDAVFAIARRPQGEITILAPLWFGGLEGETPVSHFLITFIDGDGALIGNRNTGAMLLPCEEETGEVAGHWFEVFFSAAGAPVEAFDGIEGTLSVGFDTEDGDYVEDSITASLRAAETGD